LRKGLTKQLYNDLSHVALAWSRTPVVSGVAVEHARLGMAPRIAVLVPTLMTVGAVVASTQLIATVSATVGKFLSQHYALDTFPIPLRFGHLCLYQLWHERFDSDAGHRWLRETTKSLSEKEFNMRHPKMRLTPAMTASNISNKGYGDV
jgi:DNA-binding transcriptional LysR family regulator